MKKQARKDGGRDGQPDELERQKGAGPARQQAEQHPEDATNHKEVTLRGRYPGRISKTGCLSASAAKRSTGSPALASKYGATILYFSTYCFSSGAAAAAGTS